MMMHMKTVGVILLIIFIGIGIFSVSMFICQYMDAKNSKEQFEQLEEMVEKVPESSDGKEEVPEPSKVVEDSDSSEMKEESESLEVIEKPEADNANLSEEDLAELEDTQAMKKYSVLYARNNDFIGWIVIDGTNVNYPVMQTSDHPDYYLKRNFDKEYSNYGVPYIEETCVVGTSNNIVIYGHHMKDGSMFADLVKYYDKDYRDRHPLIQFDTISSLGTYEVVAVFKFDTDNETFCYNEFVTMDEDDFTEFMEEVHKRQAYDTGIDVKYGDQLLTLSTCEYTYHNGRFVVVAKKVE